MIRKLILNSQTLLKRATHWWMIQTSEEHRAKERLLLQEMEFQKTYKILDSTFEELQKCSYNEAFGFILVNVRDNLSNAKYHSECKNYDYAKHMLSLVILDFSSILDIAFIETPNVLFSNRIEAIAS